MTVLSKNLTRATVPLSNLPERTKIVGNSVLGLTVDGAGFGTFSSSTAGYCQKSSDGRYWIHVEFHYTGTGNTTGHDIYYNTFSKADSGVGGGAWIDTEGGLGATNIKSNIGDRLQVNYATNQDRGLGGFSFECTKPSWFDANKEAGFSIAAQVEDATATTSGLAPARSSLGAYMSTGGTAQGSVIPFDTVYESTGTGFTSNGSGLFTCNFTGHILINIQLHTQNLVGGDLALRKNGVNYLSGTNMAANGDVNNNYGFNMAVASGDTIDFVYVGLGGTYQYPVASQAVGGASTISLVRIA